MKGASIKQVMGRWGMLGLAFVLMAARTPSSSPYWPEGRMDPHVPKPADVLGYTIGDRVTEHHEMERYIHTLADASPRVRLIRYGMSYEHRAMYLLIISSEKNIARLDEIREAIGRLADPVRTSEAEARAIVETTPIVVWLNYANDGDESAAFEAAIETAYILAAGQDERIRRWLDHAVVIFNMAHNPDSHQKFVAWFKAAVVGSYGNPDPQAAEHAGDWRMKSNYNHYLIDLNRDAFALSQRENLKVAEQFHQWLPQIFIDHHGETKNMYFPPYARPVNQNLPPTTAQWAQVIGEAIARAFDRHGWSYYTGEIFDLFYPGYWDSYPALNGAIGMTFETDAGGRKGYQWEREDGTIVTFRDGIRRHITASLAALEVAVENRQALLMDYYRFRATALAEARRNPVQAYILDPSRDPEKTTRFVALCLRHRIAVHRAERSFSTRVRSYLTSKVQRRSFPAGTFVIPMAQPQARLIQALFEADPQLDPTFLQRVQEVHEYNHRIGKRVRPLRYGFYDVTAWALPLAYGLDVFMADRMPDVPLKAVETPPTVTGGVEGGPARYAYAFAYTSDAAAHLLAHLLDEGLRIAVATRPFTAAEGSFPRGTVIVRVDRNRDRAPAGTDPAEYLRDTLDRWARHVGVRVIPLTSAYTREGIDLGSNQVVELKRPRVAVLTEEPVSRTSYGAIWFLFEQMLHYPFTPLRWDYFHRVDLNRYHALVIPDADPAMLKRLLGKGGIQKIEMWVRQGGVLVLIKRATGLAADKDVEWTTAHWLGKGRDEEPPHQIPGAIVRVRLDDRAFLTLGYDAGPLPALVYSNILLVPTETGLNVGVIDDNPRMGGFIFEDTLQQMPGKAYIVDEPLGRGHVILFADDPIFRLFWFSHLRLFLNAVFLAPSF